jgi:hypothetical protein
MRENPSSPSALVKQLTTNIAMMLKLNYDFPVMVLSPEICLGHYNLKANLFLM